MRSDTQNLSKIYSGLLNKLKNSEQRELKTTCMMKVERRKHTLKNTCESNFTTGNIK